MTKTPKTFGKKNTGAKEGAVFEVSYIGVMKGTILKLQS